MPDSPGVYLFKDRDGRVIYVGKAISLRARLRSYVPAGHTPEKQSFLAQNSASMETIVTRSDLEALLLEHNLIQKHRPRYNVIWRDDKSYPYLEMTIGEDFPRIHIVRRGRRKGSRYFGPYTAAAAKKIARMINQYFRVPSCRVETDGRQVPCLYYHLNWCDAPCAGKVTKEAYAKKAAEVRMFLEGGVEELGKRLSAEMERAVAKEEFEEAAKIRDRLKAVSQAGDCQAVTSNEAKDLDVIGLARSGSFACLALLSLRSGKLVGKQEFAVRRVLDVPEAELVASFLERYYGTGTGVPPQVVLPLKIEFMDAAAGWLASMRGGPVDLRAAARGKLRELVDLARRNAAAALASKGRVGEDEADEELSAAAGELGLKDRPSRIEGIDLSQLHGEEAVGAVVVFRDGLPSPAEYRRFLIKTAPGNDDFESMREVARRRLKRMTEGKAPLPDLLLLDGGQGHLNAVEKVVRESGLAGLPLAALAKRDETLYVSGRQGPLSLPKDSPTLHLLMRVRDEAHRYVNAYQRRRRSMALRGEVKEMKRKDRQRAAGSGGRRK